jgi:hypothetical protein
MTILATDGNRFSTVVKSEYNPASAFCRDVVTYNGTAVTLQVGAVLGAFIASPVGTAGTTVGTGNGVMGAITATSALGLELGTYVLKITKAVTNAGDFEILNPSGRVVGLGQVGTAFSQDGLAFTLADGSADFVAGDYIPIVVTGTIKYKLVEATATDGSQVAKAVFLADNLGLSRPTLTVVNTDTPLLAMTRGPVIVNKSALTFGASVTGAALTIAYAQLTAIGILPEVQV